MSFDFSTIQNAASTAWQWTVEQAVFIGTKAAEFGESAVDFVSPALAFLSQKIQDIWNALLPYLGMAADFLKSNLGIATLLLGGTILCMSMARQTKNTALSVALVAAGVLSAVASGALLVGASVLMPNLPILAFRAL